MPPKKRQNKAAQKAASTPPSQGSATRTKKKSQVKVPGTPVRVEFDAELLPTGPEGAWLYFEIPKALSEQFPSRGLVKVAGTVKGAPIARTSLKPDGKGSHVLGVRKPMHEALGLKAGETVRVVLWEDQAPREVEVPEALAIALARRPEVKSLYEAMAFTHRKEYARWVAEAKKPETRERRVEKALEMIAAKKPFS